MDFSNESRNLQIANYLQTLRLEQNLTLEQLSDASHIPIVHLTSIEDGRFNRFDDFYLKMYLKKYTQTLGVSLEQLYAYAVQQPIEDLPKQKKEEAAETVVDPDSMQHKVQSQPATIEAPSRSARQRPQAKRSAPAVSVSPFGSSRTKPNMNVGKILIGLFLVVLIIVFLFFMVDFFRNIGSREDTPTEPPQIELPGDINLDPNSDGDTDYEETEETEPETEPEPVADTTVELDNHDQNGRSQTFTVITSRDDFELRIEHSGDNWVGAPINRMLSGVFEETFEIGDDNRFTLPVGAIHSIDAIFINDIEVPFTSDGLVGVYNIYFNFE